MMRNPFLSKSNVIAIDLDLLGWCWFFKAFNIWEIFCSPFLLLQKKNMCTPALLWFIGVILKWVSTFLSWLMVTHSTVHYLKWEGFILSMITVDEALFLNQCLWTLFVILPHNQEGVFSIRFHINSKSAWPAIHGYFLLFACYLALINRLCCEDELLPISCVYRELVYLRADV